MNGECHVLTRSDFAAFQSGNVKSFYAIETQRSSVGTFFELARQHTHPDQVAAMYAFEALRDHRFHSQQTRSFRRPITRRPGAVFLTCEHHEWHALALILHRRVINAHTLRWGLRARSVKSNAAFRSRYHEILDANVRERSAHHHLMVAASRAVAVKVSGCNAAFL